MTQREKSAIFSYLKEKQTQVQKQAVYQVKGKLQGVIKKKVSSENTMNNVLQLNKSNSNNKFKKEVKTQNV